MKKNITDRRTFTLDELREALNLALADGDRIPDDATGLRLTDHGDRLSLVFELPAAERDAEPSDPIKASRAARGGAVEAGPKRPSVV